MKVLFIGEGLTDYVVHKLNKLNEKPGVEVFNVVDTRGAGHVGVATNQTRKGITFAVVDLEGSVSRRFSDNNYWNFKGLAQKLKEIEPRVIMTSHKYVWIFLYDKNIVRIMREKNIKLVLNDNPFKWKKYQDVKKVIEHGDAESEYTPFYVLYLTSLAKKAGIPEATAQRVLLALLKRLGLLSRKKIQSVLLKRLEERKYMLNVVDAHVSYIEYAIELYGSYGVPKEKIFVKYNSPDTDLLFAIREKIEDEQPILSPSPHRLLHLSRLVPVKRVDLLIKALAIVAKEYPDAELVVVGRGPEEQALKELAQSLGVADAVRFCGWVDQEEVGRYLLASTIYVLAGHGGLSINDAMAFGKPVIVATDAADGTEKHLVFEGLNGLYFKQGDAQELAEKIKYLFKNPQLIKEMGESSTDIIKNKVNIHTVLNAYLEVWKYVLGSH